MRLGIRAKLLCTFGIGALLTILVGAVGITQAGAINERADLMYSGDLVGISLAATLTRDTMLVRAKVLTHILAPDATKKATSETDLAALDTAIAATLAALRAGDSDEQQQMDQFAAAWTRYTKTRDTLTLPASRAGKTEQALGDYNGEENVLFQGVTESVNALIQAKTAHASASAAEDTASYNSAGLFILGATILAVALVLGLAWLLARNI